MEYPTISIKNGLFPQAYGKKTGYRGKYIVQGFVIKLLNNSNILVIILIFYSYYFLHPYYTSYIYYITYPLCVFKRFYSKIPETSKYTKQYKKEYELTQEQKESIIGIMLADGFLEKGKSTYNTRLRIDHTYPDQKSYVFSLYTLFGDLIDMEPVIVVRKADSRTGKIYKSIYIRTLKFPCLNEYHSLFYKEQKKVIPLNIQDLLTARGLAHLIMGDGFLYQGIVMLCTESFTKEEQELLINALHENFGIKATLNKRINSSGVQSYRIRISKKSMDKLTVLVKPYFIPEMLYKLGI